MITLLDASVRCTTLSIASKMFAIKYCLSFTSSCDCWNFY